MEAIGAARGGLRRASKPFRVLVSCLSGMVLVLENR
jgi:hypothetical protein